MKSRLKKLLVRDNVNKGMSYEKMVVLYGNAVHGNNSVG